MSRCDVIFLCGECHQDLAHTTARFGAYRRGPYDEGIVVWQCTGCGVQYYYHPQGGWQRIPAAAPARSYVAVDE